MPVNLELKARYTSTDEARSRAAACGASPGGVLFQQDTYFRVPRGRLKLRETRGERGELIYYERPDDAAERWSRFTREWLGDGAGAGRVLAEALGVLATVRKRRELYLFRDARIHIDEVEELGTFVEFEVTGGENPATLATMKDLRSAFAIDESAVVKVSYSDMILAKRISGGT